MAMIEEMNMKIGTSVHYVSFGTPGGEYTSQCRAATITAVVPITDTDRAQAEIESWDYIPEVVDLFVMNPTGLFFNQRAAQDEANQRGGTWHLSDDCPN